MQNSVRLGLQMCGEHLSYMFWPQNQESKHLRKMRTCDLK